jgi:hypothetical protein
MASMLGAADERAEDKLLAETVDFTGTVIYLEAKVPAVIIGVVRNGETVVRGYGEISDGSGKEPDGDTLMRGLDHQGLLRRGVGLDGGRRQGQFHRQASGSTRVGREDSRA